MKPGEPTSPDPVRFVLAGDPEPCRLVFGPLTPDPFIQFDEVGQIDTPEGPTFLGRGVVFGSRTEPDLEINGIDVWLSSGEATSATWALPPTEIGFSTRSLDEAQVRGLLPELVQTADMFGLARALADHIDGADVAYAGQAPEYDVGLTYDDGALTLAGRGVPADRFAAYLGVLGAEPTDGGEEVEVELFSVEADRARDATVIRGSRDRQEVSASDFLAVLEALLGDGEPTISVSLQARTAAPSGCDDQPIATSPLPDARITAASVAESDVGDLLRVTFEGLPPDEADPQLLHIVIGHVELVAPYQGGPEVMLPATLTHAESRLLVARLEG